MRRIAFLLVDGYALMSTAAALEPLRAANLFAPGAAYDITLLSTGGAEARSSIGAAFPARPFREVAPDHDLVFVVAGGSPGRMADPALMSWLRQADRRGAALGGISGGAVVLARAGLLAGRRFTVHWHHYDEVAAMPGDGLLERRLFVIDRDRYTCAGGTAPLDMMHAIIARDHGTAFAQRISDWFIQTEIRGAEAPQTASRAARYGPLPRPVADALELMDGHVADPLDLEQIAALCGISPRQLGRQFRAATGRSVMAEYRRIRLETGRGLIVSTRLPLSGVALMTGFAGQAHFSDAFRREFGIAPSSLRRAEGPAQGRAGTVPGD
ncbi:GlxA family transcriptional regulator [Mangrovicoccus algicola]|uniref:GlxA family transcriptional regulator n=1 Tax=Mangrovicoccus algicola TaxID=2771008 RepID=A0A8J7CVK8_9RHOB|nr:GlxA family transcriptional regulator [Mangrovicoccus algicola]MBE3638849.1 GlxA family transcriptional regulator [Mangrovicoccus algicola]